MLGSLRIAQIGLQAQKAQLDAVAQNLSNANTPAYKRISVDFAALVSPSASAPRGEVSTTSESAPRRHLYRVDLTTGELRSTNNAMDLAIAGDGFIEVEAPGNREALWRGGRIRVLEDGSFATAEGYPLRIDARAPQGTAKLSISADGIISGVIPGETNPTALGSIELVSPANATSLSHIGQGLFLDHDVSNQRIRAKPGELGLGTLASGKLESANVQLVDETVNMMMAQRVYELNAKVAQAADEIMALTNNLRK